MIDQERMANETLLAVRMITGFGPNVKIAIVIDHEVLSPDVPAGIFSEIKLERLAQLANAVKQNSDISRETSIAAIAAAMKGPAHG